MKPLPKLAWYLGYAGLLPFFILTISVLLHSELPLLKGARLDWWLAGYAAVILSFLGAVHWGVVLGQQDWLKETEIRRMLNYSVVPALLAWLALLLPVNLALLSMGALVVMAYICDSMWLFERLKSQYARLRLHLTVVAALLLFAAGVGVS
ncbi:MAG: DUF3429 domain-containing protein [Thiolinea sp.]